MYPGGRDGNNSRLLPIILLAVSAVAIVATIVVLWFYGIYFFFFFLPITFSLPWSIKRFWRSGAKKQWNVEDLR
jgi:dolichyl-phosphate-mannose--protein O-mannosyl transferase